MFMHLICIHKFDFYVLWLGEECARRLQRNALLQSQGRIYGFGDHVLFLLNPLIKLYTPTSKLYMNLIKKMKDETRENA